MVATSFKAIIESLPFLTASLGSPCRITDSKCLTCPWTISCVMVRRLHSALAPAGRDCIAAEIVYSVSRNPRRPLKYRVASDKVLWALPSYSRRDAKTPPSRWNRFLANHRDPEVVSGRCLNLLEWSRLHPPQKPIRSSANPCQSKYRVPTPSKEYLRMRLLLSRIGTAPVSACVATYESAESICTSRSIF